MNFEIKKFKNVILKETLVPTFMQINITINKEQDSMIAFTLEKNRTMTTTCGVEFRQGKAMMSGILLLAGIISVGNGFSPNNNNHCCNRIQRKPLLFATQHKIFRAEDQWNDEEEHIIDNEDLSRRTKYYESSKRTVLGGAAIGTLLAINGAVDMSAGAEIINNQDQPQAQGLTSSVKSVLENEQQHPTGQVTLPYLEKQIKSAEDALRTDPDLTNTITTFPDATTSVSTSAETPVPTINSYNKNGNNNPPSLFQYTRSRIPGWIETGGNIYKTVEPKIVAGGMKLAAEVDRRVTPKIIEVEHQLLGNEKSMIVDETLSYVARGGNMLAGLAGKVLSFGVVVAKAVPQVIDTGVQVYQTVDKKILPEVIDTSRKIKTIVDKTVPEVVDTGQHAYNTIMPEVANAEKQLATALKEGITIAVPIIQRIENKIVPELVQIERNVLGNEQVEMIEKSVSQATQQGQNVVHTVEKVIPDVLTAGQQTSDSIVSTGRSIAKNVPIIVETGKHVYETVDKSLTDALSTTQDIASDLDRAG